ncbi:MULTISPECIES: hypothetical protein [Actinomyces]|uniref:DUF4232 domain-containing protein n=1 Tax=Actinomyces respiraculi TaxID=2744574 RepID=A0A7T0PX01_9ACTO|nr:MULTISPECIES: hypothetical protein [Actinomyces]QPL05095.1 hypothetical protein ID810_10190 [Actinomyces respiraculi]
MPRTARPSASARRTGEAQRDPRTSRQTAGPAERRRTGSPGHPAAASPAHRSRARTGDRPSQGRHPVARSQTRPAARRGRTPRQKPRQPRYWLRWLLVIGVVIAILAAGSYAILAAATWTRDTIREQDEQQAAEAVVTVYPDPVACSAEQLEVVTSAPTMVATGAGLSVNATLTNKGSEACLLDVGGASLGLVITSGGVGQWNSLSCPAEPTQRLLLVNAGESATATLTWDGRVSTGQCAPTGGASEAPAPTQAPESTAPTEAAEGEAGADGEAGAEGETGGPTTPAADPSVATEGTYVLHLELGGVAVTGEHVFIIG